HLNHADYDADRDGVIGRAVAAGVGEMVEIGYDLSSSAAAVRLAGVNVNLFAAVGVHPHDAGTLDAAGLSRLRALAGEARVVGIRGVLTFQNARDLQQTVSALPIDRIVLETDCPYLAPHPHRGKRNEPAYVPLIAEKLAELHGCAVAEVAAATTSNARRLFPR